MKTMLKRWWQVVVPVAAVAALAGVVATTQTGCGGSSCSNVAGGWTLVEIIKTSTCPGLTPTTAPRTTNQTLNQTGCDVTFVGQTNLTGKVSGSTVTVSGSESGWYYGGVPIMRNITTSTFTVSGNTYTGTLNWGFTLPSGPCTGTSTVTGTK